MYCFHEYFVVLYVKVKRTATHSCSNTRFSKNGRNANVNGTY